VALRERVAELSRVEPAGPRWTFRWPSRRVVLAVAAAALVASFVAAGVTGLSGSGHKEVARLQPQVTVEHAGARGGTSDTAAPQALRAAKAPVLGRFVGPTVARLQRYDATLRLRVQDVEALSNGAQRAMRLTRSLGGYVASVQYATKSGKRGAATLVLRVPVTNLQTALGELTTLGTILQQHTALLDVTKRADAESKQIAKLEQQLANATPAEAPAIRARLATLRAKHARLVRSARLARVVVTLTTPAPKSAAAPGRIDRTLDDAGNVLVRELEILLYALVVAGPLLVLGGIGVAAGRAARRRADARLLERA
jgi:type IV secretory pathway VirJ component